MDIRVREVQLNDIDLIANYWLESDPDFLVGMGVDLDKLPSRKDIKEMLTVQIHTPIAEKKSYALIWELNGVQIGHSNVNGIEFEKEATMHLHLWQTAHRKKGMGTELVKRSLPFFFDKLRIKKLICEPYALNDAPNKTLRKVGFDFIKKYNTIPGALNFMQEVNRWELTLANYNKVRQL